MIFCLNYSFLARLHCPNHLLLIHESREKTRTRDLQVYAFTFIPGNGMNNPQKSYVFKMFPFAEVHMKL